MDVSFVARCARTGQLGALTLCSTPACDAGVLQWDAQAGFALLQGGADRQVADQALEALRRGFDPGAALDHVLADDPDRDRRQVAVMTRKGRAAARTGTGVPPVAGHRVGETWAALGAELADDTALDAAVESFVSGDDAPLLERLVLAVGSAVRPASSRRRLRSAGVIVVDEQHEVQVDLRLDDVADPLAVLQDRLATMADEVARPSP